MRSYMGYLPPEQFRDFYEEIIKEISERFELKELSKKNRIPHITFKSPFETSNLELLENFVSRFCKKQKCFPINIGGYGDFDKKVIYLAVKESVSLSSAYDLFSSELENNLQIIQDKDYDKKTFHMTLVKYKELENKFDDIWSYLQKKEIKFTLPFDNLTIFRKDKRATDIRKTYWFSG